MHLGEKVSVIGGNGAYEDVARVVRKGLSLGWGRKNNSSRYLEESF